MYSVLRSGSSPDRWRAFIVDHRWTASAQAAGISDRSMIRARTSSLRLVSCVDVAKEIEQTRVQIRPCCLRGVGGLSEILRVRLCNDSRMRLNVGAVHRKRGHHFANCFVNLVPCVVAILAMLLANLEEQSGQAI